MCTIVVDRARDLAKGREWLVYICRGNMCKFPTKISKYGGICSPPLPPDNAI